MSDHPSPKSEAELVEAVQAALHGPHDYTTSAEALVTCALAAFNYAAHVVGPTGFQASWAALKIVGDLTGIKGPFGLLKAEDLVYPQYDLRQKLERWITEWTPWAAEQARAKLAEYRDLPVAPDVADHWRRLAEGPS